MKPEISYQLLLDIATPLEVAIGRLGSHTFPAGRYVYTGSARRHLEARLARHLRQQKRCHWHIDFLLAAAGVRIIAVERSTEPECALNQRTPGRILIPGFGAGDCRAGCGSHLKYIG